MKLLNYVLQTIESHRKQLEQKQIDIKTTLEEMDSIAERVRQKLASVK